MRSHRARSIAMLVGPALLAGSLAASGATLAAGFEYCDEQGSCAAAIAWTVSGDFKQDDELSGAACATATACLMVNDEKGYAQYFTLDGAGRRVIPGGKVALLPDADDELDAEAAAFAGGSYYVIGSHGRGRHSNKLKDESFFVVRALVDAAGQVTAVERSITLRALIRDAAELRAYAEQPLRDNGANIEGLAIVDGHLLAGFRGPSTDAQAYVLSVPLIALFSAAAAETVVTPLGLGTDVGIRDMAAVGGGFLLLTGPLHDEVAEPALYFWDGVSAEIEPKGRLTGLPVAQVDGKAVSAKAEGLLFLGQSAAGLRFLVIFDGQTQGWPHEILVPGLAAPP